MIESLLRNYSSVFEKLLTLKKDKTAKRVALFSLLVHLENFVVCAKLKEVPFEDHFTDRKLSIKILIENFKPNFTKKYEFECLYFWKNRFFKLPNCKVAVQKKQPMICFETTFSKETGDCAFGRNQTG